MVIIIISTKVSDFCCVCVHLYVYGGRDVCVWRIHVYTSHYYPCSVKKTGI